MDHGRTAEAAAREIADETQKHWNAGTLSAGQLITLAKPIIQRALEASARVKPKPLEPKPDLPSPESEASAHLAAGPGVQPCRICNGLCKKQNVFCEDCNNTRDTAPAQPDTLIRERDEYEQLIWEMESALACGNLLFREGAKDLEKRLQILVGKLLAAAPGKREVV